MSRDHDKAVPGTDHVNVYEDIEVVEPSLSQSSLIERQARSALLVEETITKPYFYDQLSLEDPSVTPPVCPA